MGISLEKALELVNAIKLDRPERPAFRMTNNPNHHIKMTPGGSWFVHYTHKGRRCSQYLSHDVEEARRMRDDLFRELGYI